MGTGTPCGAGRSSYDLIDAERLWSVLPLTPGMTVLDLGCGSGGYTLPLSKRLGSQGRVIALDLWSEGIDRLRAAVTQSGIGNVEIHLADAARPLPLAPACIDLCLMATVLHDFAAAGLDRAVLAEVARVLKPEGILAVIEFIKQEGPPGPPKTVRLSLGEVSARVQPLGLIRTGAVVDLSPHLYFARFQRLRPRLEK